MPIDHHPSCLAMHLGEYLMEPSRFAQAFAIAHRHDFRPIDIGGIQLADCAGTMVETSYGGSYVRSSDGIASINLSGMMMKGHSKYGGTSTIAVRASLRAAIQDKDTRGIMLVVDSPGGHVAGTQALADDVRMAAGIKPLVAHIEDLGASAAYWAVSGAQRITANRTGMVGSIGVINVVQDTSGAAEAAGIQTHVITTGKYKGAGIDGAPVTDEHLAYIQERVDGLFAHFAHAVQSGRGMSPDEFSAVSDGRVFSSDKALALGLVDDVASIDQASAWLSSQIEAGERIRRNKARTAQARVDLI